MGRGLKHQSDLRDCPGTVAALGRGGRKHTVAQPRR